MTDPSRILFVDDEPQILESFKFALRRYRQEWEVSTAGGGEQALAALGERAFDVVVSDMRMPGMDGSELLKRVKELQPDAVRWMLSADAGQDALLRTLPVAHQYLPKPCGMGEMRSTLARLRTLRLLIADPAVRRLAGELQAVPSLPSLLDEVERLAVDPQTGAADFARVIEQDAGMSAKVLQLASSAFFGAGHAAIRIPEAVAALGSQLLRTLLRTAGIFDRLGAPLEGFDPGRLKDRSRRIATLSGEILGAGPEAEVASTAARLCHIGQLVLAARATEGFGRALAVSRAEERPLHQVEQELLGTDHAALGGYILGIWGLSPALVDAVTHHCQPERLQPSRLDPPGAVHIAEALISEALGEHGSSATRISPSLFKLAGVEEGLAAWRSRAAVIASAA